MSGIKKLAALTAIGSLLIVVAGWCVLISPKNAAAAETRAQAEEERASHASLERQIEMLVEDEKRVPQYQAALSKLKQRMPDAVSEPALIREIYREANASDVLLRSITPAVPTTATLVQVAAPSASAASSGATGTGAAPTPGAEATEAPPAPAGPTKVQGLSQIPVNIQVVGTYDELKDFLNRLANFDRAFLVASVDIKIAAVEAAEGAVGPAPYGGLLAAGIGGIVFSAGDPAVVGTIDPRATAQATPTATGSSK